MSGLGCPFTCDYPGCMAFCMRVPGHNGFCNCLLHTDFLPPTVSYLECSNACEASGCMNNCAQGIKGHEGPCKCLMH